MPVRVASKTVVLRKFMGLGGYLLYLYKYSSHP
jgi:hypothetical protein